MADTKKIINEGGINGTGERLVNLNSSDYKALQKAVEGHYKKKGNKAVVRIKLISIRLQMGFWKTC